MPHEPLQVGRVEVIPLCDGWAPLPLADELPGREVDWEAERARFSWAFAWRADWAWHAHAFLLRTPAGLILVDTGIGHLGVPPYDVAGRIDDELASVHVDPAEIGHVVHTHLHADHSGGACRPDGEPRFPNATHHVHPADWGFFGVRDDPEDFNGRVAMARLDDLGMLDLEAEDRHVAPGVRLVLTPGHTPGHRSVVLTDGDATLLLAGDLLHLPIQVAHPGWRSGHDEEPEVACRSRDTMLARARDRDWLVAVGHFGRPFGRVRADGWMSV